MAAIKDTQLKFSVEIPMTNAHLVKTFLYVCLSVMVQIYFSFKDFVIFLQFYHFLYISFLFITEQLIYNSLCPFVHSMIFYASLLMNVVILVSTSGLDVTKRITFRWKRPCRLIEKLKVRLKIYVIHLL